MSDTKEKDEQWGQDLLNRLYENAMHVDDERWARMLMRCMIDVAHTLCPEKTFQEHFDIIRANLAYRGGYCSHADRLRIERVFNCVHPMLGPAKDGQLTSEELFSLGKAAGEFMRTTGKSSPPRFEQPPAAPPCD